MYNYININVIIWNITTVGKIFDFEELPTGSGYKPDEVKDSVASDPEPQSEGKGEYGMLLWYKMIHYSNKFKCKFEPYKLYNV